MSPADPPPFARRVRAALDNDHLRGAVRFTTQKLYTARQAAMAELAAQAALGLAQGAPEDLRRRARDIRAHTVAHLDAYLAQAAEAIRTAGGTVHWAGTGSHVCDIVTAIARRRGATLAVKSKSMATEEVHLNQTLAAAGVKSLETDLGEYIIQLAGETPAHLIIPAIHKTRGQVAALFGAQAGHELATDTPTLTAFARQVLREAFLGAGIGITGANFVVARTGSLCLVTNEGNGRMVTSLPPVHVAVVGMEKLVPTLDDLAVLLALLPRSATGQKATTYVNLVTGPRRPGDADGPEELHVIFLDNNRSQVLGSPYAEVLHCIRCGACLNACPVYRQIGGHAYGGVYSGPIGAVLTPLLNGPGAWAELPQASSLCGACWEVCPVGIHLHDHLVRLRAELPGKGRLERWLFRAWAWVLGTPARYRRAHRLAYWLQRPFVSHGSVRALPPPLRAWTRTRTFPALARQSFRDRWARLGGDDP